MSGTRGPHAGFGPEALSAAERARAAFPSALPLLWSQIGRARVPSVASLVGEVHFSPRPDVPLVVDGASCGLALLLSMASQALGIAPPPDHIAIATVDADGSVQPVDGIREKLRAVRAWAPGATRVLVAANQECTDPQTLGAWADGLTIIRCANAAQAITAAYGGTDPLVAHLEAPRTEDDWAELADSFLSLILAGRAALRDWTAVFEAARIAERSCPESLAGARRRIGTVRAIAARHEGRTGEDPILPPHDWIHDLPGEVRLDMVAHLVQHCADTGAPSSGEALAIARAHLASDGDAHCAHLRLLGAYGRLLALGYVRGGEPLASQRQALAVQERAARGFAERLLWTEVTYPLAEWYRLAGALRDGEALERAERFRVRAEGRGALDGAGGLFVELARSRARLEFFPGDSESLGSLARTNRSDEAPSHVRAAATCTLALHGGATARDELKQGAVGSQEAATQLALQVLRSAERQAATTVERAEALEVVRLRRPGVVGHLLEAASAAGEDPTAFVGRWFPY